jgi:hypothetical protein
MMVLHGLTVQTYQVQLTPIAYSNMLSAQAPYAIEPENRISNANVLQTGSAALQNS